MKAAAVAPGGFHASRRLWRQTEARLRPPSAAARTRRVAKRSGPGAADVPGPVSIGRL